MYLKSKQNIVYHEIIDLKIFILTEDQIKNIQ